MLWQCGDIFTAQDEIVGAVQVGLKLFGKEIPCGLGVDPGL
jgi:hypothetical protein